MKPTLTPEELRQNLGKETGVSDWVLVDQARIDQFADVTEDHQGIHVDPAAAALTPFGGTIAHGFLSMSLLSRFAETGVPQVEAAVMGINYGFDKLRFLTPVRAGSRLRGRFVLKSVEDKPGGQLQFLYGVSVEIEGQPKPALVADWLFRVVMRS